MLQGIKTWLNHTRAPGEIIHVAAVTIAVDRDPEVNLAHIASQVDAVLQAHPDTDLVFFGELLLGWFDPGGDPAYHRALARPLTPGLLQPLAERCRRYGIYLSFGLPERDGPDLYNTQVLIDPQGQVQAIHRKWNLKGDERLAGVRPGPSPLTVTDIQGWKTALLICSDAAHPRTIWRLLTGRFDLILLSLADDQDPDRFMARFNARLYDAWVVTANRFGHEGDWYWDGHTVISDPWGELQAASQDQAGVLVHTLHLNRHQNLLQRLLRNLLVKAAFLAHLLRSLPRLRDYL